MPSFQNAEGVYNIFACSMAAGLLPLFFFILKDKAGLGLLALTLGCILSVMMLIIGIYLA